uniref:Uncharacterized protein n=1 Tax=Arundo donax TaxID=35708 RepID=A0A0A9HSI4_ARUDO
MIRALCNKNQAACIQNAEVRNDFLLKKMIRALFHFHMKHCNIY